MIFWVWLVAALAVGFIFGLLAGKRLYRENLAGTLREDHSDPDEAPYLFLELSRDGLEKIHSSPYVSFKVELKNYIDNEGG